MSLTALDEIQIEVPASGSRILVGAGLLARLGDLVGEQWPRARTVWLITDETVERLYGATVAGTLAAGGPRVVTRAVAAGEASKAMPQVLALYDWLLGAGVERGDVVVALGGGVVGDLAGFVAATGLRGLPLVQVPTTLLAMVDSSVGGKTGVNHATGKNLIGAFYQPPLVVVDTALLATLPPRELAAGWAEVIKYGLIERSIPGMDGGAPVLLPWLEREVAALTQGEPEAVAAVVRHCIDLKARVVRADPYERGLRAILNYGHTVGHALEAVAGYGRLLHGEAVAIGMRAAASLAVDLGRCAPALLERQQALVRQFNLPEAAPGIDAAAVWPYMRRDKKASAGGGLRWVLPGEPGVVDVVSGVDEALVQRAVERVTGT